MNSISQSVRAWEEAIKAAKVGHRGLNIWPGDRDRVRIEDLPTLADGWSAGLYGRAWDVLAISNDKELQQQVKVGRSYGLGIDIPDPNGYYMVVEQ